MPQCLPQVPFATRARGVASFGVSLLPWMRGDLVSLEELALYKGGKRVGSPVAAGIIDETDPVADRTSSSSSVASMQWVYDRVLYVPSTPISTDAER